MSGAAAPVLSLDIDDQIAEIGTWACIRDGGGVKRWHARPIIGEQTVASHSWGVATIIHYLWPDCSRELLLAALYHDVAEKFTGDTPADAKWREPRLKSLIDGLTGEIEVRLGIQSHLNKQDQLRLSIADRMEMLWFCVEQRRLGNKTVQLVFDRVQAWFDPLMTAVDHPVRHMLNMVTYQYSEACKS